MKLTSLISWCLITCIPISSWSQSAVLPDDHVEEIKLEVQKRGTGERARVKVTLQDKAELKGYISQIEHDSFQVSDKKTGKVRTISYEDVSKVQRQGLSKPAKILIVSGIIGGALIGIAVAVACHAEGGPHC